MYIMTFYCSPVKKNGSTPHFFLAGDATGLWLYLRQSMDVSFGCTL